MTRPLKNKKPIARYAFVVERLDMLGKHRLLAGLVFGRVEVLKGSIRDVEAERHCERPIYMYRET